MKKLLLTLVVAALFTACATPGTVISRERANATKTVPVSEKKSNQ